MVLKDFALAFSNVSMDFPGGSDGKGSTYNAGDPGSIPVSGRSPLPSAATALRRKWQPTPVFLNGKFHRQRCLAGQAHG